MIKKTCCFTGPQYQTSSFIATENHPDFMRLVSALEKEIRKLIKQHHVQHFISGMDPGIDIWCAEIVLKLKREYSKLRLECVLPYETQAKYWPPELRTRYEEIISSANKVTLISNRYHHRCIAERNQQIIDISAFVLAVWNGEHTDKILGTIKYAYSKKKKVIVLNPSGEKIKLS